MGKKQKVGFHRINVDMESFEGLLESNTSHVKEFEDRFGQLQEGQSPEFVTVCCSDSRVLQDYMWGRDSPGSIFTVGNIGNRVVQTDHDDENVVSGDVIYPVVHTDTDKVVIIGHTGCGAVTATYEDLQSPLDEPKGVSHCIDVLERTMEPALEELDEELPKQDCVNRLVEYNVDKQIDFLMESDEFPDGVTIMGVVYDFQDVYSGRRGQVHVVNLDGEKDPRVLKNENPEISHRVERLWKI